MNYTHEDYKRAVEVIRSHMSHTPRIGLVLGSGLGGLADELANAVTIPYDSIPGWPVSTVHGHGGKLVIGELEGKAVLCQQGRAHFYEGYSMSQVTFAIRVMHLLGIETVILTNAAGGLNPNFRAGDVMLITDHINLPGMTGQNPLMGPNDELFGPRFPSMTRAYDRELIQRTCDLTQNGVPAVRTGVYIGLSGPTYETPAEIRMMRTLGADAVGMSTVHEVVVARHAGMRVLAFSGITNIAIDDPDTPAETNHEEVLEVGRIIVPKLTQLIKGVVKAL